MHNTKPTFALVTRLQQHEAPFINEFLAYYRHLGIDRFYLINTDPNNGDVIRASIAPEHAGNVEHFNKRPRDSLRVCPNMALPQVTETFLLHVDMDEFLYLDGMRLPEFVEQEGLQNKDAEFVECRFSWIMSPLCLEPYASSIRDILHRKYFFPSMDAKSLARTQDIVAVDTSHEFHLKAAKKERRYDSETGNCFVFHVSARGVFDIVNKVCHSRFPDVKSSSNPGTELYAAIFDSEVTSLPNRFVLAAFQNRFQSHVIDLDFEYPDLRYETDLGLLRGRTLSELRRLLNTEVSETDLNNLADKMKRYPIRMNFVDSYAAKNINFQQALLRQLEYTTSIYGSMRSA